MVSDVTSPSGMDGFRRKLEDLQRQIDSIRGAAFIKSSIMRAASFLFQSEDGDNYATLGQFAGWWWQASDNTWQDDTMRGIGIGRAGDLNPSFSFGHAINDDKMTATMGEGDYGPLDSLVLTADETRIRADTTENTALVLADNGNSFLRAAASVTLDAHGGSIIGAATDDVDLEAGDQVRIDAGTSVFITAAGADVNLEGAINVDLIPGSGDVRIIGIGSHATPANLSIAGSVIRQVSSAAEYKDDIEDIDVDVTELLSVSGKTYVDARDKENAAKGGKQPERFPGFIADEWAAHPSLRQFVQFDEHGKPQSFFYDRVSVAHHEVLKHNEARITALEAEVADLKATVATLLKKPKDDK